MKNKIKHLRVPYAMTVHDKKEINAVVNTLKTSTQMGKKTKEFENKISCCNSCRNIYWCLPDNARHWGPM